MRIKLLLGLCLLATGVQGWGGWKSIASEVNRAADNVGREVNRVVSQVERGVKHVGAQVEEVYHEAVKEVEKVPEEVESWFVEEPPGPGPNSAAPGVTVVRRRGCRPLTNHTVDFSCSISGQRADCAYPQAVGTVANIACKPGYKLTDFPGFTDINCTTEFKWSRQYFTCVPDCGKGNVQLDVRMSSSAGERLPQLPWHVDVFNQQLQQVCAGSLITTTLVLSAASCFSGLNSTGLRLLAGSVSRDWSSGDKWAERRDVAEVLLAARFSGRDRLLADDVALVRASEAFTVSGAVNTVCVDWFNGPGETALADGDTGLVASWPEPSAQAAQVSNSARTLSLSTFETCVDEFDTEYLTHDKLCAAASGTAADDLVNVCSRDAGTGLVFPLQTLRGARYYLRGVLSHPLNVTDSGCYRQKRALFTQFSAHLSWARAIVFPAQF